MADALVQLDQGAKVERWIIDKKLGEGAFGAVYKCSDKTGQYALKVEGVNEPIQLLKMEVFVLNELSKSGGRHFCKIEDKGRVNSFNYVVMTLVGKSLQDLRLAAPGKKFSVGTAISVGIQCLEALEDLHGIGYLHRDVKPANYTIGRAEIKEVRKVYVLDFGMARKFVHEDGTIKKPRTVAGFRGTVKYAPVACHAQREMCRLDDLETWLYMQVELTKGSLPWRNLKDMDEIGRFKKSCRFDLPLKQLFGGCPREYIDVMRTIDGGRFFDEPDYQRIYGLLKSAMRNLNATEFPYDWERWEEERKKREEEEAKRKNDAAAAKTTEKKEEKEKEAAKKDDEKKKDDEECGGKKGKGKKEEETDFDEKKEKTHNKDGKDGGDEKDEKEKEKEKEKDKKDKKK
uniref:non-specific serine/threonine protein kinase n=1 Tax=Panagrellus redivivus TaxID=6233 RepID=A0A7E4V7W2_PANRE